MCKTTVGKLQWEINCGNGRFSEEKIFKKYSLFLSIISIIGTIYFFIIHSLIFDKFISMIYLLICILLFISGFFSLIVFLYSVLKWKYVPPCHEITRDSYNDKNNDKNYYPNFKEGNI